MKNNIKIEKWENLDSFSKPKLDILLGYQGAVHVRFMGKQSFTIDHSEFERDTSIFRKIYKILGNDIADEAEEEYKIIEDDIEKKSEKMMEMIYNLIHAEAIKSLKKHLNFQKKWEEKIKNKES